MLELVLAACNGNGHVREAAVVRLSETDHAATLPVLALRAADWVPQVRDRARLACRRRLDHVPAPAFAGIASVALALRDRRTGDWLAGVLESLLREGPDELLAAALTSVDRRTRRLAYTAALAADRLGLDRLLRSALTDGDLPIRIGRASCRERVFITV